MSKPEITIPVAILALLRGEVSARYLTDTFGVTEAQVHQWVDVFTVGGVLALNSLIKPKVKKAPCGGLDGATTFQPATTTPLPTTRCPDDPDPATTLEPGVKGADSSRAKRPRKR